MTSRTAARLADAFLLYLVGVTLLVTLIPFNFTVPESLHILWGGTVADSVANVLMFAPLGFLYRLTRHRAGDRFALRVLGVALAFSLAIEVSQLFLPTRSTAPLDLLANGLGGWFGGMALDLVSRRLQLTPALVGALALELPLMGLVYLLIPLLWVNGIAAGDDRTHLLLSVVLGQVGAIVLAAVYRHRLRPTAAVHRVRYAAVAAGWFLVGALPGLVRAPVWVVSAALSVGLGTYLWSLEPFPAEGPERRFEGETLRRLAPLFLLYLVLLAGWPPWSEWVALHGGVGTGLPSGEPSTMGIVRLLEQLAAFTLLGYLVAESRGRLEQSYRASLGVLAATGTMGSMVIELVAAAHPGPGASVLRGILGILATCYGGSIYHLQRSHIRALLGPVPMLLRFGVVPGMEPAALTPLPPNALLTGSTVSRRGR